MLFYAFILAVVLTAIAYYKRHNLILWLGVAIAWGSLAREGASGLLHQVNLWLFGA